MLIEVMTRKSLSQPQDMPSTWVGEPCYDAVKSKNRTTTLAMEADCVTIETKDIAIQYMHTKKVFMSLLTKPTPSDTFKFHMLSLGINKVQFRDISCHVMDKVLLQCAKYS